MIDQPDVVLDLSRLLSRVLHPTPTGVDRVEMAYARGLLAAMPERLRFAAVHPTGLYGRLPRERTLAFLDATEERWQRQGAMPMRAMRSSALRNLWALRPRLDRSGQRDRPNLYVQVSPNNLTRPALIDTILRREQARFVCLVHDLIPIEFPEYARPDGAALHRRRVDTIVSRADGILTNSHATLAALQPYLDRAGRTPEVRVAHLGTDPISAVRPEGQHPYFVCVGTIEPRKNHLLLLHIWRSLSERHGPHAIPRLILIGRRGWENEQVVDMLERCPALVGCVEEKGGLPDREVQAIIAGAQALLLPSFAEGYGMPVTEALTLSVPVVCSDLPALHEAGGGVPEFIDPLDGPGWTRAIMDLAGEHSAIRAAQRQRLAAWRAPGWPEHIAILCELLHKLGA